MDLCVCAGSSGVFIALLQFVAGAYLSSYLTPVDTMLRDIRDRIMELEDPTTALKYYGVIADSLAAVWRGMSLLTTTRGRHLACHFILASLQSLQAAFGLFCSTSLSAVGACLLLHFTLVV